MFSTIPEILDELRAGRMIVLVDDEDRENEGDLVIAAEFLTPEIVNFMIRQAGGYLFVSLPSETCDRLDLHGQTSQNTSARGTPLTVTIDGHPKHGFTTGVSADERCRTIKMAIDPASGPGDFVRPGHVNPLRARDGGVLVRFGHTEGMVDLARLAGLTPAAVGIEICNPDGTMARRDDLAKFCAEHGLKMATIEQLVAYRLERERLVKRIDPLQGSPVDTRHGPFTLIAYESVVDPLPHLALVLGGVGELAPDGRPLDTDAPTLVRMHRRDLLGDVFGVPDAPGEHASDRQLDSAMRAIQREGRGAIVYLRPSSSGESLSDHLVRLRNVRAREDAPDLHSDGGIGAEALPMHMRAFGIGGQILRDLGLRKLRLLTNSNRSMPGLDAFGLEICQRVALD
ncbi:MAG: bifunctional 3,4-dihydroxy-2-butanone-4-phosphate synthase/GTP cyclohydrolase II [Phycisphaerales bacterium]